MRIRGEKAPCREIQGLSFRRSHENAEKPDVIQVFGNPEQIGRLIQAKTYFGGYVKATLTAKTASCAEAVLPALNGEVTVAIPGAGDRVFQLWRVTS
ncbi:MAG: hypothetical protein HA489_04185 [Archaeoglobales archaeon]|nr:hypothetical protein [Archaeoglobales archaeon]